MLESVFASLIREKHGGKDMVRIPRMHKECVLMVIETRRDRGAGPNGSRPPWIGIFAAEPGAVEPIAVDTAAIAVGAASEPFETQLSTFQTVRFEPITDAALGKIPDAQGWIRPMVGPGGGRKWTAERVPRCGAPRDDSCPEFILWSKTNAWYIDNMYLGIVHILSGQARSDFMAAYLPAR